MFTRADFFEKFQKYVGSDYDYLVLLEFYDDFFSWECLPNRNSSSNLNKAVEYYFTQYSKLKVIEFYDLYAPSFETAMISRIAHDEFLKGVADYQVKLLKGK